MHISVSFFSSVYLKMPAIIRRHAAKSLRVLFQDFQPLFLFPIQISVIWAGFLGVETCINILVNRILHVTQIPLLPNLCIAKLQFSGWNPRSIPQNMLTLSKLSVNTFSLVKYPMFWYVVPSLHPPLPPILLCKHSPLILIWFTWHCKQSAPYQPEGLYSN